MATENGLSNGGVSCGWQGIPRIIIKTYESGALSKDTQK